MNTAFWIFLLGGIAAANLPWIFGSYILTRLLPSTLNLLARTIEWLILFGLTLALGFGLEQRMEGTVHHQEWPFYTAMFFLYSVAALPGFVYYLFQPSQENAAQV